MLIYITPNCDNKTVISLMMKMKKNGSPNNDRIAVFSFTKKYKVLYAFILPFLLF